MVSLHRVIMDHKSSDQKTVGPANMSNNNQTNISILLTSSLGHSITALHVRGLQFKPSCEHWSL